jgi:hypothetical protein
MSLTIRILKFISIISFLIIPGLHENGVPNFALLAIYLFQFFNDVFGSSVKIFWEGLTAIPIFVFLIIFFISKRYKILLFSFIVLFTALVYLSGVADNYNRINFWFIALSALFIISSLYVAILIKNKSNGQSEF